MELGYIDDLIQERPYEKEGKYQHAYCTDIDGAEMCALFATSNKHIDG